MQMAIAELTRWGRRRGRGAGEIGALTEPIVGVEAAREAADGVEHVEAERPAELRRQAQQEAGDAAEVGPHRRGRRRRRPHHEAAPEHRGQRRELLRRRRAPYAGAPRAGARGRPAVLVVPRHGRRGHRGDAERERLGGLSGWPSRSAYAYACVAFLSTGRGSGVEEVEPGGGVAFSCGFRGDFLRVFLALSGGGEGVVDWWSVCADQRQPPAERPTYEWNACLTAHHAPAHVLSASG